MIQRLAILSLLCYAAVKGEPTADTDLKHNHSDEYFDQLKSKEFNNRVKSGNGPLIVHLIPHSHDDVGWLKTVDQYYSGTDYNTQRASVELTITNVINELLKDPKKRFS
jgi:hypothetical protein